MLYPASFHFTLLLLTQLYIFQNFNRQLHISYRLIYSRLRSMTDYNLLSEFLYDQAKVFQIIQKLMTDILQATSRMPKGLSTFHTKHLTSHTFKSYFSRFIKFFRCSTSVYIIALIYIDRMQQSFENFVINHFCVHKLFLTAMMIAAKYNDDNYYKNKYYAEVGGVSLSEMNRLEAEFLTLLDYNVFINTEFFQKYLNKIRLYEKNDTIQ